MSFLKRKEKEGSPSRYNQQRVPNTPETTPDSSYKVVSKIEDMPEQLVKDNRILEIGRRTYTFARTVIVNVIDTLKRVDRALTWIEPDFTSSKGEYGKVFTQETHGGHVFIIDDTEGNKRIIHQHANLSYRSMVDNGDAVDKTVKDKYEYVGDPVQGIQGNLKVFIYGDRLEVVEGDNRMVIRKSQELAVREDQFIDIAGGQQISIGKGDSLQSPAIPPGGSYWKEVEGTGSEHYKKDYGHKTDGNRTEVTQESHAEAVGGNKDTEIRQNETKTVGGVWDVTVTGNINIKSSATININSGGSGSRPINLNC